MKFFSIPCSALILGLQIAGSSPVSAQENLDPPAWVSNPPKIAYLTMGQSYNTSAEKLESALQSIGYEPDVKARWAIAGADTQWYYGNVEKTDKAPSKKLKEGDYDILIFTPNLRQWNPDRLDIKVESVKFYTDLVREANPRAMMLLNSLWPSASQTEKADRESWIRERREMLLSTIEATDAELAEGTPPLLFCPRGEAIELVYDWIAAGQVPGIDDVLKLYGDGGHAGEFAHEINGIMEAAVMTQTSPMEFPDPTGLSPEQARIFKTAALHALLEHPGTGFEKPADNSAPPTPSAVETVTAEPARVVLRWQDSRDPESGVAGYLIERSDGAKFETVLPQLIDTTAQEDTGYQYTVRSRNFAGMTSEPSAPHQVQTPPDTTSPAVSLSKAGNSGQIQVFFSEPLLEESALNPENFRISEGAIKNVRFGDRAGQLLLLEVEEMEPGKTYQLAMKDLRDRSKAGNVLPTQTLEVPYEKPDWEVLDRTEWDGTVVDLQGDNLLIRAKGGFQRARIFKKPRIVSLIRPMEGDFSFTVALTSQEKADNVQTGIVYAPSREVLEQDEMGYIAVMPEATFQMDVPVSMEAGLKKARSIMIKGERGEFIDFPVWLRLVRKGDQFSGYFRKKGSTPDDWKLLGSFTADKEIPDTMLIGVFHHGSDRDDAPNTAMFDLTGSADAENFTNPVE